MRDEKIHRLQLMADLMDRQEHMIKLLQGQLPKTTEEITAEKRLDEVMHEMEEGQHSLNKQTAQLTKAMNELIDELDKDLAQTAKLKKPLVRKKRNVSSKDVVKRKDLL